MCVRYHLVDGDDDLLHSEGEGQQSVLAQLTGFGVRSLELNEAPNTSEHSRTAIKLGGPVRSRS